MRSAQNPAAQAANGSGRRRSHALRVFLVGTEFWRSAGGIQYVNRLLARALLELSASTPMRLEGFSYGDARADIGHRAIPGVQWHAFDRRRGALCFGLARRLLAVRPHLVIFTHANLLPLATMVRRLAPRAKVALLTHGVEVWDRLAAKSSRALRAVDQIVAPSAYTRERLVAVHGVEAQRVSVLPHGLDPEWKQTATKPGTPRNNHQLLCVARLARADAYKGVDVLLRAMPHVLSRCPEAHCIVAGDGDDRARLQTLARNLGVGRATEFRGEMNAAELMSAYREADLFVLPSSGEGFGIVFAEAMFCGLPVVAARAAATPEVVADGETGILVPPDSPQAVGSAVAGLLLLEEERQRMGAAARRRVESHYLFTHFAARWHLWLARCAPEAVYLARHAAVFARPAHRADDEGTASVNGVESARTA